MRCSLLSSSCLRNVSFCCIPILLFYVAKSWLSHILHHEPSTCNSAGAYTYAAKFFQRSSSQKFRQVMKFQCSVPPEIHVWPLSITPLQSENFLQMCIHEKDQPLWPQYIKQHLLLWLLNVMRTVQQEPDSANIIAFIINLSSHALSLLYFKYVFFLLKSLHLDDGNAYANGKKT